MSEGKWNYFSDIEVEGLDLELVAMIDQARHISETPYFLTDKRRSGIGKQDRNAVNNSAHLTGNAVDIRCQNYVTLYKILKGLFAVGFNRIGIYHRIENGKSMPTHIHADNSKDHPQEVVWITEEK